MALQWQIMPVIGTLAATDWVRILYSSQTSVISMSNDCNMLMINYVIYCTEKMLGWWGGVSWGDVGTFLPRLFQFWSQLVRTAKVFIIVLDKFHEIITETFSFCCWSVVDWNRIYKRFLHLAWCSPPLDCVNRWDDISLTNEKAQFSFFYKVIFYLYYSIFFS